MKKMPVSIDLQTIPMRLRWVFDGAAAFDSSCSDEARVIYLDTGFYLKIQKKGTLADEAERGKFFDGLGLGVEILDYVSDDRDYLLTRAADGEDMTHFLSDPRRICRILADSLRRLHSIPAEGIALSAAMEHYLRCAEMQDRRDVLKADTLIHGDACLPNVIVKDGAFSSFIDFSQAGLGDRHIDLYWAVWSLQFNLGTPEYTDYFLDCYGRDGVDLSVLRTVADFEAL